MIDWDGVMACRFCELVVLGFTRMTGDVFRFRNGLGFGLWRLGSNGMIGSCNQTD